MTNNDTYDKNPFRVPENYFEGLNDRILENTVMKESPGKKSGFTILKPLLSLAAVIAGAAVITFAILQLVTPSGRVHGTGSPEMVAEIPQFLIDGVDMFLIESGLEASEPAPVPSFPEMHEEIIEYLLLSDVEISMLYEFIGEAGQL